MHERYRYSRSGGECSALESGRFSISTASRGKPRGNCSIPWAPMPPSGTQSTEASLYRIGSRCPWPCSPRPFWSGSSFIFHDCGHGSLYTSRSANRVIGFITGTLTLTPYYHWRWQHALHHGTSGDLDRRGTGDIWMLTIQEYLDSSRWRRFAYRLARNPLVLFVVAPFYVFVIHHRFSSSAAPRRERRSVRWTNLAIVAMACTMGSLMGFKAYLVDPTRCGLAHGRGRHLVILRTTSI